MIKVFPTLEQNKTIEKYGLRHEDVELGPADGEITVRDSWRLGENERFFVIDRNGEFEIRYKNPGPKL